MNENTYYRLFESFPWRNKESPKKVNLTFLSFNLKNIILSLNFYFKFNI